MNQLFCSSSSWDINGILLYELIAFIIIVIIMNEFNYIYHHHKILIAFIKYELIAFAIILINMN